MNRTAALLIAWAALTIAIVADAKLPPQTPEAKATADAAKEKAAWGEKVAAYKLCQVQDKLAAQYFKTHGDARKPTVQVPACTDPGPYVAAGSTAPGQVGVADARPTAAAGKPEPAAPRK